MEKLIQALPSLQDLTLQEAETIALSILKQVMEEKVKSLLLVIHIHVLASILRLCHVVSGDS